MSHSKNIKRWIDRINDSSGLDSVITETLLKIRPHSKRQSGISDIVQNQGVECLLKLIQRPSRRILDVAISILANCLTESSVRKKVLEAEGILSIVKILQTIKCDSVLTRTCRSIANLASDEKCSNFIHSIGTVKLILSLAKQPKVSPEYLTSAFRAIKNLASTPGHRKKLIQHGAVSVVTKYLDSDSKELVSSSLRALVPLSEACSLEFADHMLGNEGAAIGKLVKIIEERADLDMSSESNALYVITSLTLQGCARPTIGNVGGLRCIANEIKSTVSDLLELPFVGPRLCLQGPLPDNAFRNIGALCYYCREAINRAKMKSTDTLPVFVRLLWDKRWARIHPFILYNVLFFEYHEEGLKALHESGIFAVLLHKLVDFSKLEKPTIQAETKTTVHDVWDGRKVGTNEEFDRRHSLSYDVPTKFNQRTQIQETLTDTDPAAQLWAELCRGWRGQESAPYSPQWSPLGLSPVSEDFAFASKSASPDSPSIQKDRSPSIGHDPEQMGDAADHIDPLLDQDDSSSSREGFDLMHSPALLPATGPINILLEGAYKRDCISPTGSEESEVGDDIDFMAHMEKDLKFIPKRAKIENLAGNDERIRSRSLDTGSDNVKNAELPGEAKVSGASSPPQEFVLSHLGSSACSPNFLRFVNETCSVSPQLLKHAGRDTVVAGTSTTTSALKQTRRRTSGAAKKLDDSECDAAESCQLSEAGTPTLVKSVSNPLPVTEDKPGSSKDTVSVISRELKTPVQMILYLLCHYCEVSDSYVASLAQQDHCTASLVEYMQNCPTSLDPRLYRILDRLASCPESFSKIVTSCLMPCIAAAASLRTSAVVLEFVCDNKVSCSGCGLDVSCDCASLIDNMWHHVSLSHSSIYGSDLIKKFLTSGSEPESVASACTVILLFLWLRGEKDLKSMSDSLCKELLFNLQLILDRDKLQTLCKTLCDTTVASELLQSASYTVFKLASFTHKSIAALSEVESGSLGDDASSFSDMDAGSEAVDSCEYERHCESTTPDKILVFPSKDDQPLPSKERTLRSMKTRQKGRSKTTALKKSRKDYCVPVHVDVLCARSLMFEAMLTGKYRESSEKRVPIQDVRYETALYIIHYMYGCNNGNCMKMRKIFDEVLRPPRHDRYEKFFGPTRGSLTPVKYPVELDILRVMDLWLLHEARDGFYARHRNVFLGIYVKGEISFFQNTIWDDRKLRESRGSNEEVSANFDNLDDSEHIVFFWDFVNNQGFNKIAQDYVDSFCSPCLFRHNHILFREVFSRASSFFGGVRGAFFQLLVKRICDALVGKV